MKAFLRMAAVPALTCALLAGCIRITLPTAESPAAPAEESAPVSESGKTPVSSPGAAAESAAEPGESSVEESAGQSSAGEIDRDAALALALEDAGVPEEDASRIQVERGRESGIPVFQVEFETAYGDYDCSVAVSDGKIVDADYEVEEEQLDPLGGCPVTLEEAKAAVQDRVPGADAGDIRMWEESEDGRGRFEGELFHDSMKYEFEIDPQTGIILDWSADLRE